MPSSLDREPLSDATNPLGLDGIEFIEYATSRPQALGQVLEMMGFRPVARHRSREVLLYRQGGMNVVINAHVNARPRSVQRSGGKHRCPPMTREFTTTCRAAQPRTRWSSTAPTRR